MRLSKKSSRSSYVISLSLFLVTLFGAARDSFAQSAVQVASATPQSPTASVSVSYSSAQTSGDLNVVVVGWNDTTAEIQSVEDSAGNTYYLAIGPTIGQNLQQSIYYASNIASGGNTVTVSFNQNAASPDVRILEYRGLAALDVTAGASGNSATSSSGSATTRNASELILGANTVATLTTAPGTGFTKRIITSPDGDIAEDKVLTAVGSSSATATLNSSGPWVMQMVGFSAVSGPAPNPEINFPNGFAASNGQVILNRSSQLSGSALQLTGAVDNETGSAWYATPVNIQSFVTNFTFQLTSPSADGFTFAIQDNNNTTIGGLGVDLGYGSIPNSVAVKFDLYNNAGEGPDSTGIYTDGASPTIPAIDMTSSGVDLHSGDIMSVQLTYDGTTLTMTITDTVTQASFTTSWTINIPATVDSNTAYVGFTGGTGGLSAIQDILSWTYSDSATASPSIVSTPTFSIPAGTYTITQSVAINDATPGVTIYYTTDGATPTTSSLVYTTPIVVSSTETVEAIAVASGYTNSAIATATYSIAAAAPTFSVPAGTYSTTQSVAISDATSGATIYYTTDGTMPTTSSTKYSAPISVSATETISAIAIATGYAASPEVVAKYIIGSAHSVTLSWDAPSSSTDPVAGYNIYRAASGSSSYQLLNSSIDTETTYVDSTVQSGAAYTYYVKSVDSSGNQSAPSNQGSVTIP